MNRFDEIKNIQRHRKEVQRIAKEKGYSFPFHDFWKMINVFLFGDKIATKLHRRFSRHHPHTFQIEVYENGEFVARMDLRDIKNKVEAAIDWESARFTKPDKPLNAYDTWRAYFSDIEMGPTLKKLGFWRD
jgi:hypothetical protein